MFVLFKFTLFYVLTQAGAERGEVLLQAVQHVCVEELGPGDSKLIEFLHGMNVFDIEIEPR